MMPGNVPNPHAEAARQLAQSLQVMQDTIEGFVMPPKLLDAHTRLRGHQAFPDEFFVELAVAIESSEVFANALRAAGIQLTPAEIRDMLRYAEAYLPVADALERFARGIRYTVYTQRAKVSRAGSAAYRIARGMNLLDDASLVVPGAEAMKRTLKKRRRITPAP